MTGVESTEIAAFLGVEHVGPPVRVAGVESLDRAGPSELAFCKYDDPALVEASDAGAVICPTSLDAPGTTIRSSRPRKDFIAVANEFFVPRVEETRIHPTAIVADSAEIGDRTVVGPFVRIGADVTIGDRCEIDAGTVIGTPGFGFQPDREGELHNMIHQGGVRIEDDVRIGPNSVIDRAAFTETVIGRGTKLHNLCHIGHNVVIGERARINQFCSLSGSVEIGDRARIHPHVSVANHTSIGADAEIGMNAAVLSDIPEGATAVGTPAKVLGGD
ncbi:DapH/DapD/GlmU-related protein [Natronorarus salvus]|uniref:DapH/DapD/GlmU-related protein n=1 Tax=Natronorarus salvus TaxID=3117733 RepID=UPI002F2616CF